MRVLAEAEIDEVVADAGIPPVLQEDFKDPGMFLVAGRKDPWFFTGEKENGVGAAPVGHASYDEHGLKVGEKGPGATRAGCANEFARKSDGLHRARMVTPSHFLQLALGTVVALLPIINPLASAPVFMAITEGDSDEKRTRQALRGCLFMVGILVAFLVGGSFIMRFFGLSIPGLRIAGGLLVCGIAFSMYAPPKDDEGERRLREEARAKRDISFTPLAMPMLSGPGSIAVTIGLTSLASQWMDYFAIIAGILVVAVISYIVLRISGRVVDVVGHNAMSAFSKIMGFLLLCIGIQFIVNGVTAVLTDHTMLQAIRAVLRS